MQEECTFLLQGCAEKSHFVNKQALFFSFSHLFPFFPFILKGGGGHLSNLCHFRA
jgi:hypothetical protein